MAKPLPEISVRALAGWSSILSPHFRGRPDEEKAEWFLSALADPDRRLRFELALRRLRHEWELLEDEAALQDAPLRLQARILELGGTHPAADELLRVTLRDAPIAKLFGAILAQAVTDGADTVRIEVAAKFQATVLVRFDKPSGWEEVMRIPQILFTPLRGAVRRAEFVGYERVRAWLAQGEKCPASVRFLRNEEDVVEIAVDSVM